MSAICSVYGVAAAARSWILASTSVIAARRWSRRAEIRNSSRLASPTISFAIRLASSAASARRASAERSLSFLHAMSWQKGRLLASYKDDRAVLPAYLDDYAFLLNAVLELLQARWRSQDLVFAQRLADALGPVNLDRAVAVVGEHDDS